MSTENFRICSILILKNKKSRVKTPMNDVLDSCKTALFRGIALLEKVIIFYCLTKISAWLLKKCKCIVTVSEYDLPNIPWQSKRTPENDL